MNRDRKSRRSHSSSRSSYSANHGHETRSRREEGFSRESRERNGRRRESQGRSSGGSLFKKVKFHSSYVFPEEQIHAEDDAIRSYKSGEKPICDKCGLSIGDMGSAVINRTSGKPEHFDCALAEISETEKIGPNERITYIGQGRFGILEFPNIHDMRHFTIKKIIDWEDKDSRPEWRDEIATLYSQVR